MANTDKHDGYGKRIEKYFGEIDVKGRRWTCGCTKCKYYILMGEHPEIEIAPEDFGWL